MRCMLELTSKEINKSLAATFTGILVLHRRPLGGDFLDAHIPEPAPTPRLTSFSKLFHS